MRHSKSRYVAGLQCDKLLWLKANEPTAPELVPSTKIQAVFDTGHSVGRRARDFFLGGTLIEVDPRAPQNALSDTQAALAAGARVVFEASFEADDTFVSIDVLEKRATGWALLEVKGTLDAKPQHLSDLAVQTYVARRCGLHIERIEVMHLSRAHRHPNVRPLFEREDVTAKVNALEAHVAAEIERQLAMIARDMPDVSIGSHCSNPNECPFTSRCWPVRAKHDVSELYGISHKSEKLRALGYQNIVDIPDGERLTAIASRQRLSVLRNETIVEPGLSRALRELELPLTFLDFETVMPALPAWTGCAPLQAVPVQFSVHRLGHDGSLTHHAFLAEGTEDPRERLVDALLAATGGTGSVLAWSASFEKGQLKELEAACPKRAKELRALGERLVDLLPITRNHVYHPEFRGSFSLKAVAPALVPELAYDDLEIADGQVASTQLMSFLFDGHSMTNEARDELRTHLLAYCERDTLVLVRVLERLRVLAAGLS